MQKEKQGFPHKLIRELIIEVGALVFESPAEEDRFIEKFILNQVVPLGCPQDALLQAIKDALTDPDLDHPRKYLPLLYLSLLQVESGRVSDLFKFYYELTSHAIRQLREGRHGAPPTFWNNILEKTYQYGMLLLVGSRSILLNIESLGARVHEQVCFKQAKQMRLSRLVKVYNCLICIPEQYLSLKQTLYLTLIFTRWQNPEQQQQQIPFFTAFTQRTQKKLIRKLRRYPQTAFSQEHVLNLIKIVLGGDQLIFSHFLQLKYTYQALKTKPDCGLSVDRSVFNALRKCPVIRQSRHLFNFVMGLVIQLRGEGVLKAVERESILFVSLKYLSGKFENNEGLYVLLVKKLLHENNPVVAQLSFRFIRQESLQFLTVHKLKLLLNMFNVEDWRAILKERPHQQAVVLGKLERVLSLLGGMARRYSQSTLVLYCQPERYGITIKQAKNVKSLILVISFDGIGRLNQCQMLEMGVLKLGVGKDIFEIVVTFVQNTETLKMEVSSQPKQRLASLVIKANNRELANERKQYLRFGQGCFQSLVVISLVEKRNAIAFCIDGAYFQFPVGKKGEVTLVQAGRMTGSIRTFFALKAEIELVSFYKTWCQWNRKAKFVVESLGTQNIVYRLNNREETVIVDANKNTGFSFFQAKTEINLSVMAVKHLTFIDILLQLGGLQTIFFILERFSRSLVQFRNQQEKINILIADFFNFLRTVGLLDESNALLVDIHDCFKYLNEFLFLLIKRNRAVRESHNSFLLMSIFQLLVYFRHSKHPHVSQNAQARMTNIEASLVLRTLANFEIWSHCSNALQLFVLSQIELYIKGKAHLETLVRQDLHRELLSGLILFQTSDASIAHFPEVQAKIIALCMLLYDNAKNFILTAEIKTEKDTFTNIVERDLSTCFTFIKVLLRNGKGRPFSQSEKRAFALLSKYVIDNFIAKKGNFQIVGKVWHSCANILVASVDEMEMMDREILQHGSHILVHLASQQDVYDVWLLRYMESLLFNPVSTFIDGLQVLIKIMSKYFFETQRKHTIIHRLLIHLRSKLPSGKWAKHEISLFRTIIQSAHPLALYHLSTQPQFFQLFFFLKEYFITNPPLNQQSNQIKNEKEAANSDSIDQGIKAWNSINELLLLILYSQKRITNANQKFVSNLILNSIQVSSPLAQPQLTLTDVATKLAGIKQQAKESHKQLQNSFTNCDIRGAFALIQHCRGWQTMQFLIMKGLLTIDNDLNIPFLWNQSSQELSSIGGTVGYYLSQSPSPLQLFVLFTIILYRQLSNSLTILTTQANIAIFHYAVEFLLDQCQSGPSTDELWMNVAVLVVILKDVLKLLNNSFINKTAAVFKDIDRLLGSISKRGETWKSRKSRQIVQNLARASEKLQAALEDTKVDKDMAMFIELISCKLTLIHQKDNREEIMGIVYSLTEELRSKNWSAHEQQFKKLNILGIKFFKIARDYFLARNSEFIIEQRPQLKIGEKIGEPSAKDMEVYLNYWNLLSEKFDGILEEFNDRGNDSEQVWQNLLISNQHWFQLQEDLNDITTKFYELDQKETGPFGLYKLNIRPVRSDHQKLPYPRKKDYSEIRSQKQLQKKEKEESMLTQRMTIKLPSPTLFSTLAETVVRQKSIFKTFNKPQERKEKEKEKQYFCEYVTKRGVYAGILKRRKSYLQFRFIGHSALPPEREYQTSTNKCHRIQQLCDWEQKQIRVMRLRLAGCKAFSRRYILRHTAFEIFHPLKHRSYFFNLFFREPLQTLFSDLRTAEVEVVERRAEEFAKAGFTQRWKRGELSNFEYLGLINRYSGRTTNDLAQYFVYPWVIANYNGQNNFRQLDKEFCRQSQNMRDLSLPTGKLNSQKFNKLKARLREVDASDRQIRFLYGTIYSNPTVLYNFFIRLQPYTSLHWQHQGRKIDHADRLFSGIHEQFTTILTSSSDMKQLAPQFYYWTQFLRNRNRIDLGRKQKGEDVDAVVLPVWARTPEEFIFKMRQVLESNYVSEQLHQWIDLIFGYKSPIGVAEEHDNLYHYQCYEHDLFEDYETENEMKIAQIAISQFGQVAEQIFTNQHPKRNKRRDMSLDTGAVVHRGAALLGFQLNDAGILVWSDGIAVFKKAAIAGLFGSFEWNREYFNQGRACLLTSINLMRWVGVTGGILRVLEKGRVKMQRAIESRCLDCMGNYIFHGFGSKVVILEMGGERFEHYSTLYGHRDEVILIRSDFTLDLILSVDRSGYVLLHQLTDLRFMRAFHLGTNFEGAQADQLRVCLHRMGYFLFLDHEQTLWIYNYMGQLLLEQDLEVRTNDGRQEEERITGLEIFSHEHSLILLSSTKGNIFLVNFLEIIRFKDIYPFKTYSRLGRSILAGVRSKAVEHLNGRSIKQFSLVRTVGGSNAIYQLLVLYQCDQLVCYSQQKQMGSQLQANERLKAMGFF